MGHAAPAPSHLRLAIAPVPSPAGTDGLMPTKAPPVGQPGRAAGIDGGRTDTARRPTGAPASGDGRVRTTTRNSDLSQSRTRRDQSLALPSGPVML